MIPKGADKDLREMKNWRPIALLSCLGKGLERAIARRISHQAILSQVLADTHFGALPRRAATDLAWSLVADIEALWEQGLSAAALLLDIKGAFDTVTYRLLINRLRMQGYGPCSVIE